MPIAWRLVKPYRVGDAFTGEGARLFGGRWNSVGTPMVYAAETKSLAALEILVHVDAADLMDEYLCLPVRFDKRLLRRLDFSSLPVQWRNPMPPAATQHIGDAWAEECGSVVLEVPSVLIPGESNYLINPRHPNIGKLKTGPPEPFEFDPRLLKQG
ncbi:RES family NAD+ phosphorylase [Pontiellaceae bacterium B1224]|nr:RES family NAD+ phosphorylase [Pontiellaceae bacterium B1224]